MNSEPVLTLDWPALVGSGALTAVVFLALVERLRRTFATQTLFTRLRESNDDLRTRLAAAGAEQKHQWERVAELVIRPLERITDKLEGVSEVQAAQKSTLEHIEKRLDRTDGAGRGRDADGRVHERDS